MEEIMWLTVDQVGVGCLFFGVLWLSFELGMWTCMFGTSRHSTVTVTRIQTVQTTCKFRVCRYIHLFGYLTLLCSCYGTFRSSSLLSLEVEGQKLNIYIMITVLIEVHIANT